MILGIVKNQGDARIPITPEGCKKLQALSVNCIIEKGAGEAAGFSDTDYLSHAEIKSSADVLSQSDLLISVEPLSVEEYQ